MLGTEWGKGKETELVKKVLAQQRIIAQGGTTVAKALAGGQVHIAVGTYAYKIEGLKKQGAPVDWVAASTLPVLNTALGVIKTAPHPNAARFFAGWLGGAEGQKIRYSTSARPSRWAKTRLAPSPKESKPLSRRSYWNRKDFATILEIQRELGKLLGALR